MIGDDDPEDAYDASDPLDVRLAVIALIVKALATDVDVARRARRRADVVRLLERITDEVRNG